MKKQRPRPEGQADLFGAGPATPPVAEHAAELPATAVASAPPANELVVAAAVVPVARPAGVLASFEVVELGGRVAAEPPSRVSTAVAVPPVATPAIEAALIREAPLPALASPAPVLGEPVRAELAPPRVVEKTVLTVSDLTRQIKGTLERGFTRVLVRGEVSNFRGANPRGHLYFSLKDAGAQIDTKIWASLSQRMKFKLREGLSVVVEGHVDVYEPQGRYSLIVDKIDPEGEGALALAFQQLKERLVAEGLMGDRRSRPLRGIPFLPRRIGVVTSKTGAALQDFLRVLHGRHPRLSVLVADARVQGEGSAAEVVRAIQRLSRTDVDVIVVTRGGGSLEDLWTFNEESVARAIFACPVPVVSAIGHEIDFTISDFVADFRAPTPSAAAEKLAPVLADLELSLATSFRRLAKAADRKLLVDRSRLSLLQQKLVDPRRLLDGRRLELSEASEAITGALRKQLRAREVRLRQLTERLSRQRPEAKLAQNRAQLQTLNARLSKAMVAGMSRRREALRRSRTAVERKNPLTSLGQARARLQKLNATLNAQLKTRMAREQHVLQRGVEKLEALSPLKVMRRGYAVTFKPDGHVVRRAADVKSGDEIRVRLLAPDSPPEATLAAADEIIATVK